MFRNDRTKPHSLRDQTSASGRRRRQARRQLRPIFEAMEARIVLSTLSDGGTSTLTIALADNETFGIQSLGTTYELTLSGTGTFTDGGVTSPSDFGSFGADNLAVNASGVARYSKIIVTDASTTNAATTTNVDLVDSGANSYAASLDIELNKSGGAAAVQMRSTSFTGSAGLTVNTIGGIQLISGGITTGSGSVVLDGNENGNYSAGGLIAVEVEAPITTTSGAITLTGTGGNATDNSDVGVRLINGGKATTASGPITITGHVQPGSGGDGVSIFDYQTAADTGVTSATGNISITGDGASSGVGVVIADGATISSTGTGPNAATITVTGSSSGNDGVYFASVGTHVATADGNVTVHGSSGSSGGGNAGVYSINGVAFGSTGAGSIDLQGIATAGSYAVGTVIASGTTVSSTGTGGEALSGNSAGNVGLYLSDAGSSVASAVGPISISGTSNNASSYAPGVFIQNGATVSSTGTGANAATIGINGSSTGGYGQSIGVEMYNNGTAVSSVGGNITITGNGTGGGGIGLDQGVTITSTGTGANAATITLSGTDTSASGTDNGDGIRFGGTGPQITSVDGNISLTGNTSGDDALQLTSSSQAQIASTGAGNVTLSGTSTAGGSFGEGANIGGTTISTNTGAIQLTGTTASQNGVDLNADTIQSTGGGAIAITSGDHQFLLGNTSVTTSGPITFTSVATANGSNFIFLQNSSTVQSTGGDVNILSGLSFYLDPSSTLAAGGHLNVAVDYNEFAPAGTTAVIQGTFNSTLPATITGGPQGDTINFAPAASNAATTINGGAGDDSYTVDPTNVTGSVNVADAAGQGNDSLTIQGTNGDDTITVNATSTTIDGKVVSYGPNLESVTVNSLDGNDSFDVTPSQTATFTLNGGNPTPPASPGDSLLFHSPTGQTSTFVNNGSGAGVYHTTGGYKDVNQTGIESTSPINNSVLVSGLGTSLRLLMGSNQVVAVQSSGSTYTFTLTGGGVFTNAGVASPSTYFSGFGTTTLVLQAPGVAYYGTISVKDNGGGDQVVFGAGGSYSTNFNVQLAHSGAASSVVVDQTNFTGAAGLMVTSVGGVQVAGALTAQSGAISLAGNTAGTSNGDLTGVEVTAPISTTSGAITLTGTGGSGSTPSANDGVLVSGGPIASGSGNVTINGTIGRANADAGVEIDASVGTGGAGKVAINGNGNDSGAGVIIAGSSTAVSTTGTGTVTIQGTFGFPRGVWIAGGSQVTTAGTPLKITGKADSGPGVAIEGGSQVSSASGPLTINGTASGSSGFAPVFAATAVTPFATTIPMNDGVLIDSGATASTTGVGALSISGTATGDGAGFAISPGGGGVTTINGGLTINGSGATGDAIQVASGDLVQSTGSGTVNLYGKGSRIEVIGGMVSSATGSLTLQANGTLATGQDLILSNGASVSSSGQNVTLQARNNVSIDATSTVTAPSKSFLIAAAYNNAATGPGSVITVFGTLQAATTGRIMSGPGDDTFTIAPAATTAISVVGGGGNDSFMVDPSNATGTINVREQAGPGASSLTIRGTTGNDTINVSGASTSINGHTVTYSSTIGSITVLGLAGNDTFHVTPSLYAPINVDGGDGTANSGSPGDSIIYVAPPQTTVTPGAGVYHTNKNYKDINYANFGSHTP